MFTKKAESGKRKREEKEEALSYQGERYKKLSDALNLVLENKLYSAGKKRETILLDKNKLINHNVSQSFLASVQKAEQSTQSMEDDTAGDAKDVKAEASTDIAAKPAELLKKLTHFVYSHFEKTVEDKNQDDIAELVNEFNKKQKNGITQKTESVIPLEYLIDAKKGVCRHFAPYAAFLLTELIARTKTTGQVYCFTTNIPQRNTSLKSVRHMVVIYLDAENQLYLIDPTQRKSLNISAHLKRDEQARTAELAKCYPHLNGESLIKEIVEKYSHERSPAVVVESSEKRGRVGK